jgi:glycine/D-amino acid oxidase-like deaminating enzyme/nitrite reductase/ring-hydroxylating ferredoxin subunit
MPIAWWNTTGTARYPRLKGPLDVDVAVIGGGITGVTAALQLARAGKRVAVLEMLTVGAGSTGDSTGHLTACLDPSYEELTSRFGEDGARIAAQSSMAAIEFIERTVSELAIQCDFARIPGFRFSQSAEGASRLEREATLTSKLGLATSFSREAPLPVAVTGALQFESQARFDAPRYCRALAAALPHYDGAVYGETLVESIEDGTPCVIRAGGQLVTAKAVIMATHAPLNRVLALQNQLSPYISYTMAFGLGGRAFPEGLFWDTEEPYHYIRRVRDKERQLLLVGGEDHRTGQEPETDNRFDALETYARKNFDVQSVEYRGSGEVFASADGLPYIGYLPGITHVQVGTGFSGTGLTFGTVAGMLMADLVLGRPNAWEELYRPSRVKAVVMPNEPEKSTVSAAWQWVTSHLKSTLHEGLSDVPEGGGRIVEINGTKAAVYRDEHGELHVRSSACTHMGCTVQWNGAAQSWDCPCHGGRYRPTGEVLCGPPTHALRRLRTEEAGQLEEKTL